MILFLLVRKVPQTVVRKPTLQALVLADQIYVDQMTGKKVIAGVFNKLWAPDFPTTFGQVTWAYICVTDIQGSVPFHLRYTDLQSNEVLMSTHAINVESKDPLASPEFIIQVPGFPMPHPGTYLFEVYAGDEAIGALRISAQCSEGEKS